jgi:hypothetical protein
MESRTQNHRVVVLMLYLIPLGASLLFWLVQDSSAWPGKGRDASASTRMLIGVWQACGPVAWTLTPMQTPTTLLVVFGLLWIGYLTVVGTTFLSKLPYALHAALGTLWCLCGCPPAGLVIT